MAFIDYDGGRILPGILCQVPFLGNGIALSSQTDWFSRYNFCQPLGQGGMGTVFLAQDLNRNNSQCVIKQLNSKSQSPEEHKEAVRLFTREAEILRTLDHPGIVRVFDSHVTAEGSYFLVMDYVPGKNLDLIISTYGPFNTEATVEIAIQCCEVLEYLHELDPPILYRDLKPSNLMLTPEGRIVFIDFGIARAALGDESATRVVTTGYSPPEQYFGRPEPRSDLYALGATLFQLLTGQKPKPITASAPRSVEPSVLPSMDTLVCDLMAHKVEDRPKSARVVRYKLYAIYKEMHPEFQIPSEAMVSRAMAEKGGPNSKILPTSGMQKETRSWKVDLGAIAAEAPKKAKKPVPTTPEIMPIDHDELRMLASTRFDKQQYERNGRRKKQSFWQKIKNWIEINLQ